MKDYLMNIKIQNSQKSLKKNFASAFFPHDNIYEFFIIQKNQILLNKNVKKTNFLAYLEKTYFGKIENEKYTDPIFSIQEWSIYNRILNLEPNTTNGAEARHRSINEKIRIKIQT
ncbi:hypothetical protein DMUE_1519 [Dictyocoela muelleri]|nr:hypothetical protein DMUE_1519 [Dictyocoela muelleri]